MKIKFIIQLNSPVIAYTVLEVRSIKCETECSGILLISNTNSKRLIKTFQEPEPTFATLTTGSNSTQI